MVQNYRNAITRAFFKIESNISFNENTQKQTVLTARIEIECFIVFLAFDDMFRPVIDFYLLCLILVYSIYCICSVFIVA